MKSRVLLLIILSVILAPFSLRLQGQSVSGSINGEISDPSGATVSGAEITALNIQTGVQSSARSNASGYFSIPNLIAGTYNVVVSASGFKELSRSGVQVDIGAVVRLDSKLEVGSVQQRVSVSGNAPQLQTDKVEIGLTIESKQLVDLPSEGRNPTAFAALQAGVVMSTGNEGVPSASGSANYSFQANGQRSQLNRQLRVKPPVVRSFYLPKCRGANSNAISVVEAEGVGIH